MDAMEILDIATRIRSVQEPTFKQICDDLDKLLDNKFEEAYQAIVAYYFQKYRQDERFKDKSDKEIREAAEGAAKEWIEHHRTTAKILNGLLYILSFMSIPLGFLLGHISNMSDLGYQEANRIHPHKIPDISIFLNLLFRKEISEEDYVFYARLLGFNEKDAKRFIAGARPLLERSVLLEAWRRGFLPDDVLIKELEKHGFTDKQIDILLDTAFLLLTPEMARELFLREEITEDEHDRLLAMHGYTDEQIKLIKKLYFYIPSVPDLIRLAVREAFTPEAIEKFELHKEFPTEFAKWAKRQGLSEFWARAYWAAHWELPSLTAGYEMLHRRIITRDELALLMRMHDIAPFWRDKLMKLSYAPYTRVDVRRMYRDGVIDEREVFETYLDLGYDEKHAENLTEWTIREATSDERKLIEKIVNEMIDEYSISEEEAVRTLIDAGYREAVAELKVRVMVLKRHNAWLNKVKNRIKKLYLIGIYDEDKAAAELNKLNVPAREVSALLYLWELEKETSVRRLSEHDLEEAYKYNIISYSEFITEMQHLGYTENDAKIKAKLIETRR